MNKNLTFEHSELDITVSQRFQLPNGKPAIMKVKPMFAFGGGVPDEPIGICIIPSGWEGKYHVIVEFGDSESWDNHFMDKEQILQQFGIEVPEYTLKGIANDEPNDMSFGKRIRNLISSFRI